VGINLCASVATRDAVPMLMRELTGVHAQDLFLTSNAIMLNFPKGQIQLAMVEQVQLALQRLEIKRGSGFFEADCKTGEAFCMRGHVAF
jgi:hypothetical protein